jgi:hypothetical protein
MAKEYPPEEVWKLYQTLPQELKEAIFSEETSERIWDISLRYGIEDERISEIARYTGRVLMGLLPPEEFSEVLEKEINLEKEIAEKIAFEINRFIFYPVKNRLEELYKSEIKLRKVEPSLEEKPKAGPGGDIYREPIE